MDTYVRRLDQASLEDLAKGDNFKSTSLQVIGWLVLPTEANANKFWEGYV